MELLQVLDISSDNSQRCEEEEDKYKIFNNIFVTNNTSPNQNNIWQWWEEDKQDLKTSAENPKGNSQLVKLIKSTEKPAISTSELILLSLVSVYIGDTIMKSHFIKRIKTTLKEPPE